MQNGMVERNAGVPHDRRIVFRIGIHLGDVVEESDGDLMGDGVNIAARLEGIAKPGAICLSEYAYRQVKGRLDLEVTDLGPTQLKNIAEPIRAYSLEVGMPAQAKPAPKPAKPAAEERSGSRRSRRARGAVVVIAAASGVLQSHRPASRRPTRPPRPRVFRSSCCRSPISRAIRPGLFRRRPHREPDHRSRRASATPSSSRAIPP